MSSVGVTPPTRQVLVDDTNPSIIFTGTWGHDQGVSGIASANEEKILGPAFNNTATFSETDLSLSFTFTGTEINLNGGVNFVPTGTFGRCFIDGVVTDNSTELMIDSGVVGTNDNPLCIDSGLSDSTHVLTFNLSGIGTYTPAPGANGTANRVWIDEIVYTPSSSVGIDTVPAIIIFFGDSQLDYSAGWQADSTNGAQVTSQQNASVTFTFQGTSVDYYGTLFNNPQTVNSSATYSIDGQTPISFSIVAFQTGSTPHGVPLFRSGTLPAGQHTLTVVNQGSGTVVPLALESLIVVPSVNSANTVTIGTKTTATATPTTNTTTNFASTQTAPTSATPPPGTNTASSLNNSKGHPSAAKIGAIVGAIVVVVLIILCLLLFLRRRRQKQDTRIRRTSILREDLEYPDISGIPPPEVPTPFPLLKPQLRNKNEMAQSSQDPLITTSAPNQQYTPAGEKIRRPIQGATVPSQPISSLANQQYNSAGEKIRRPGNAPPPPIRRTTVSSQPISSAANSPPVQPSSSGKASARRTRALSDLIINHDDSGMRIPQPEEEEMRVRRVVEFPPTYAP
ncbi:hypothetical protein BJ912DRAFT_942407 [Pholiota molesta]|nr:hypothetical protein BJ912DRAFT_942407 [Pholiota molesta]